MAGTVLPTRIPVADVRGGNVALAWSSAVKNHYVPVITMEGKNFEFPILDVAFRESIPAGVDPLAYVKQSEFSVRSEFAEMLEKHRHDFSAGVTRESLQRAMLQMDASSSGELGATNDDVVRQYMMLLQARMEQRRRQQAEELMQALLAAQQRRGGQNKRPKRAYYVPEANIILTDDGDEDDEDEDDDGSDDYEDEYGEHSSRFYDPESASSTEKLAKAQERRKRKLRKLTENLSEEDRRAVDGDEELQEALLQREQLRRQMVNLQTYVKLQKLQQQMQEQIMRQSGGIPKRSPEDEQKQQKVQQAAKLLEVMQQALSASTSPRKEASSSSTSSSTAPRSPTGSSAPASPQPSILEPPSANPAHTADVVMTINLKNNQNVQKQVKIHYNFGEDPQDVARAIIRSEGISEEKYLAPVVKFIKSEVEKHIQKRSGVQRPVSPVAPLSTPVTLPVSPRYRSLPYRGDPVKFVRTGNTISLAADKLAQFNQELAAAGSVSSLSTTEQPRLSDSVAMLQADQYQRANFTPQQIAVFIRILVDWPAEKLFPAVDLFRILILYNSASEKLQAHAAAFERLLVLTSEQSCPRPVRLTALKLFANMSAEPVFTKLESLLEHKIVDSVVAAAQDDNKNVSSALISLVLKYAPAPILLAFFHVILTGVFHSLSLSWGRQNTSDLSKLRVLEAAFQLAVRLIASEPSDDLRMLLSAMGTILIGRAELIKAFTARLDIAPVLGALQPTWSDATREVAAELTDLCK